MASIYKHSSNKWVAAIRRKGFPTTTKSFPKYSDAKQWATEQEALLQQTITHGIQHSLHEAINRYERDVVPTYKSHKTARWMLSLLRRSIDDIQLESFTASDAAEFRDERLETGVAGASVNKELNILSRIFDYCIKEWGWLDQSNPIKQITRPKNGRHRDRRPTFQELKQLHDVCISSGNTSAWNIISLAIETGMRQSELLNLEIQYVYLAERIVHLPDTKNGDRRDVPLSTLAADVLKSQIGDRSSGKVFNKWTTGDGFRSTYKRYCKRAGIIDLRFHDLRHEAASRFFEMGLNQFQVAAITGHRSLQSLQRYTHLRASDLALLLK